jgi:hypothetical protein
MVVYLNGLAAPSHGTKTAGPHCLTDAMGHEPRGFVGHAQCAVQLVGAMALLA